jgi:hypothetical protein
MGGGKYIMEKDHTGASPYKVSVVYSELQSDGSKIDKTIVIPPVNFQNNISLASVLAKDNLKQMAEYNMLVWRQFQSQNYRPGVSKVNPQGELYRSFNQ